MTFAIRVAGACFALGLATAACSTGTSNQTLAPSPSPASTPAETVTEPVPPSPTVSPLPTSTPRPTATPLPTLSANPVDGSGLVRLSIDSELKNDTVGVSVDGAVRAIVPAVKTESSVSVWVPDGSHEVCIGPVANDAVPQFWDGGHPSATATPEPQPAELTDPVCAEVAGTIGLPPRLFPGHRVIAHYGVGITPALGVLGEGTPEAATERLVEAADAFSEFHDLRTLPAFEFIATVAQGRPGSDGNYSLARPKEEIRVYLDQIRTVGGIMVLDFQPGQAAFLDQVREYEDLLMEPDVHLALDPEWSMRPGKVPGKVIGSTDAETVNEVLDYVQGLVVRHGLPQKLLIVHQFRHAMIDNRDDIVDPPGVAVMFHIDGQGPVESKYETYDQLFVQDPFFNGFKLFFDEDSRVLTPTEVMAMEPAPVFISYQ